VGPACQRPQGREGDGGPAALLQLGRHAAEVGPAAVLGCHAVNRAKEKEVHRRTSS
jgi:hypothetical protein